MTPPKEVPFEQLVTDFCDPLFDPNFPLQSDRDRTLEAAVRALAAREGVSHVVLFRDLELFSGRTPQATVLSVGPLCTYLGPDDVVGRHLGEGLSGRQYPVSFARVPPPE